MLLKKLVYGYVSNIYSSRKLEAACKENIHFIWLAGMNMPDHQQMNCIGAGKRINKNGFVQHTKKYQAQNCDGCPVRGASHDAKTNGIIEINHNFKEYKIAAHQGLNSETGIAHRKKDVVM